MLHTSAAALHCGCRAVVVWWRVPNNWYNSSDILLQNSLPWSVTISNGSPYRQIQRLKMADVTVRASLSGRATNSTYLVKASVIQRINFFALPEILSGPNKSQWIRWLGSVHWGKGDSSCGGALWSVRRAWHRWHFCIWSVISLSILGHQKLCRIRSLVLPSPSCPVSTWPWASWRTSSTRTRGSSMTTRPGSSRTLIRRHITSFSINTSLERWNTKRAVCSSGGRTLCSRKFLSMAKKLSCCCFCARLTLSRFIELIAFLLRKSAGISDPFLYMISKSNVFIISCKRLKVRVCTLPNFSNGLWSVYNVKCRPIR